MSTSQVLCPRLDLVYALDQDHIEWFWANGHVYLQEVAKVEELSFYREAIGAATKVHSQRDVMLTFASRSHKDGYLGSLPISEEYEATFNRYINENEMEVRHQSFMKAGDATFDYGWNLHSAPGNNSQRVREVMTVIWVADGCRVTEPINPNQKRDTTRWMPGLKTGDLVASELNPIASKARFYEISQF